MMRVTATILSVLLCISTATPVFAAESIRISAAGLTQPLAKKTWDEFSKKSPASAAHVEIASSGAAFKKLCPGGNDASADIVFATRPMTKTERTACISGGSSTVAEMPIGYYGIVFANIRGEPKLNLTKKQIFMALAAELPDASGKLVKNPYNTWKEVDATLPDMPISVYGPAEKPGLYFLLTESIMPEGCEKLPAILAMLEGSKERLQACRTIRKDGKYHTTESVTEVLAKLGNKSIGIMDLQAYEANSSKVQSAKLEGMMPEQESIGSIRYTSVKNIYVYVNKQRAEKNRVIAQYLQQLTSDGIIGKGGYLTKDGLVALNSVERKTSEETALSLTPKKIP
jgi:phosphate transport system substrate-binding protein